MADQQVQQSFPVLSQLGRTGLRQYGGFVAEEFLPALSGRRAIQVYTEMRDNDPVVGGMLFAIEMMMRQAEWDVAPASDSLIDQEAAQFLKECMDDMEDSWGDTISEILSFLVYGFSYHEISYKKRGGDSRDRSQRSKYDDGMIGWRKIPIRSQDSLLHWEYDADQDELLGMTQVVYGEQYTIPLEKALLFRTKVLKRSPEGRSVLRNAYRPWYFKRRIEEIEAIGIDRDLAGLPVLSAPENMDLWDTNDPNMQRLRNDAQTLVQNIRQDAQMGVVLPHGWTLGMVENHGRKNIDVSKTIERLDTAICMTSLADFMMIGHHSTGTYELHRDKTSRFAAIVGSYLDMVGETFTTHAVPRLMKLNPRFTNLEEMPKITHSAVETPDLKDFGDFIASAIGSGALIPGPEIDATVRQMAELPERVEEDLSAPAPRENPDAGSAPEEAEQEYA